MPRMFNRTSRSEVDVPEGSVAEALLSGNFGLPRGSQVPVISPDGRPGSVLAEDAAKAFRRGYRYEPELERNARRTKQEYEGRRGEAVAAGVARGLTFGLSDVALTKTGLVEADTLRKLEEHNLAASLGGELAGAVVPLLIPEPASSVAAAATSAAVLAKLGRGASVAGRVLGAAPRAVVRGGKLVEGAVEGLVSARAVANPVARAIVSAMPRVAGAAVEGAAFGLGEVVSEEALGDPELGAEKTIADIGLHALVGAGRGAAFGAITVAGLSTAEKVLGVAKSQFSKNLSLAKARDYAKEFGEVQAVKSLGPTKKQTERAMHKTGGLEQMGRDLLDEGIVTARDTLETSAGKLKTKVQALGTKIGGVYRTLDDFVDENVAATRKGGQSVRYNKATVAQQADEVARPVADTRGMLTGPADDLPLVDPAKGAIVAADTRGAAAATGKADAVAGSQVDDGAAEFAAFREIKDSPVVGHPTPEQFLGAVYRNTLYPIRNEPTLRPVYSRLNRYLVGYQRNFRGRKQITFQEMHEIRRRIDDTINWKNPAGTQYNQNATDIRWAMQNFQEEWAEKMLQDVRPGFIKDFRELNRKFSSLKLADDIADSSTAADTRNRFFSMSDHLAAVMTGAASSNFVLGLGAAALNKFVLRERGSQILAGTADKIAKLSLLNKVQAKTDERIGTALGRLLEGKSASRGAGRAVFRTMIETSFDDEKQQVGQSRAEMTNKRIAELSNLRANPQLFAERLARSMAGIGEHAPATFAAIQAKTVAALDYLLQTAPRAPQVESVFTPKWTPDPTAVARWERAARGVLDPVGIIDDAADGTLSRDAVASVRTVWPELYARIVEVAMERAAGQDGKITHAARVQLAMLLDQPVDFSTSPAFTATMQGVFAAQQEQEQPVNVPNPSRTVALSRANKLNAQQHAQTQVQRVSG